MKKKIKPMIIVIVLLIIPFFYVLFFLKAFWDPYSKMNNVPVAIVNLDDGDIGKIIVEKLKESNVMKVELLQSDNEALEGVENRKYYSSITIPEHFTDNIHNLKENTIIFRSNKKNNFIASQIYERAVIEVQNTLKIQIANEIATQLYNGVSDSISKTTLLSSGLQQLDDGSHTLHSGINKLHMKYAEFNAGVNTLNAGIDTLNKGINKYVDGVNQSSYALDQISKGVLILGDKLSVLKWNADFVKLYDGAKEVQDKKVKQQLDNAGIQLQAGVDRLITGSTKLNTASNKVDKAIEQINAGAKKLNAGLNVADDKVKISVKSGEAKVDKLNNLDNYLKNSINLDIVNIDNVESYGVVFAAYFISIAIWVGCLVIMVVMYYDAKLRFGKFDRSYPNKYKQFGMYLGLIFIQAPILTLLIHLSFNFEHINVLVLWLSILIIDLAFFSMIYLFIILFDDIGKFISIMLLIIQISSSAGTFPIETTPTLFIKMFPFIPMRYSINILKESLAGFNINRFLSNVAILNAIFIIFVALILITIYVKDKKYKKKLA